MKPLHWAAAATALLLVSAARADDFADFRIPDHRVHDWSADIDANGSREVNTLFDGVNRRRAVAGNLRTQAFWLRDSEERFTVLNANASAMTSFDWVRTTQDLYPLVPVRLRQAQRSKRAGEFWFLSAAHRQYPWATPVAFSVEAAGSGNYSQNWLRQSRDQLDDLLGPRRWSSDEVRLESWNYLHVVAGSAGLGLGRVRDATGIFEAMILEQRLLESGALTRELSPAARRRIAQILSIREDYAAVLERPGRTLWQEVERILDEDGALAEGGLSGHAVLRAGEPLIGGGFVSRDGLPRSTVLRRRGLFAGAQIVARHTRMVTRNDYSLRQLTAINDTIVSMLEFATHVRSDPSSEEVLAGPSLEAAWPLGRRVQVDASSRALFHVHTKDEGFELTSAASVSYVVADRILLVADLAHQRLVHRDIPADALLRDRWFAGYGVAAVYYLENHVDLSLQAREQQSEAEPSFFSGGFQRRGIIALGVTYRITGGIRAPGLAGPVSIP